MRATKSALFFIAAFLLLSGCTVLELDKLVPASVVSAATGLPIGMKICAPPGSPAARRQADEHVKKLAAMDRGLVQVQSALPAELQSDPVVSFAIAHTRYVYTNSRVTAHALLTGQMTDDDAARIASAPKPPPITPGHLMTFAHTISDNGLRHTLSASSDPVATELSPFWLHLKAYYEAYFQGNFVTYFAQPIDKPTLSLTIGDDEIAAAAGVFLELLSDEILQPTVWTDGSGNYFPGGAKHKPTYLAVNQLTAKAMPTGVGCGMTLQKAEALDYLAKAFATAATTETSLTVKSAGGLEVGLGILGKLNIGDNSTLTTLVQSVVTEMVQRLTIAIGAPILESIDVETTPLTATRGAAASSQLRTVGKIRRYSAAFVSAGGLR